MAVSRINEAGLNINQYGNRNLIMNGAMVIDQRNGGSAVTGSASVSKYAADRFSLYASTTATITAQQVSDAPNGFQKSDKITCTSAATSDTAGSRVQFSQAIEGYNMSHLQFGSSAAKTITLSFYVKASNTGTYGGSFVNGSANRSYPYSYTISSANTWELKTVTITGDTSGTWATDNTQGMYVFWGLGVGSNYEGTADQWNGAFDLAPASSFSLKDNLNATWQVTGVQLEVGDTATDFEHRTFGDELQRCQRYYQVLDSQLANGTYLRYCTAYMYGSTNAEGTYHLPVEMRATPTLTASGTIAVYDGANVLNAGTFVIGSDGSSRQLVSFVPGSIASGGVQHRPCVILSSGNKTSKIELSAEL